MSKMERPDFCRYFLDIAGAVASRSTCLRVREGAVIVKANVVAGTGYTGHERGGVNCLSAGFCRCERDGEPVKQGSRCPGCRAIPAEENCLINSRPEVMLGATLFVSRTDIDGNTVSGVPGADALRRIINAQVAQVVFEDADGQIVTIEPRALLLMVESGTEPACRPRKEGGGMQWRNLR